MLERALEGTAIACIAAAMSCGGEIASMPSEEPAASSPSQPAPTDPPQSQQPLPLSPSPPPKPPTARTRAELDAACVAAPLSAARTPLDAAEASSRLDGVFFACAGAPDVARVVGSLNPTSVGVAFTLEAGSGTAFEARYVAGSLQPVRCLECGKPASMDSATRLLVASRTFDVRLSAGTNAVFLREPGTTSQDITLVRAYK